MKICFLINSLGAGGAERSTAELAKYLFDKNHGVTIVCLKRKLIGIEKEIQAYGIRVVFLRAKGLIGRVKELHRFFRGEKPDCVHSVLFDSNLLLRVVKIFSPKLTIVQSLVNTPYSAEREKDPKLPQFKFKLVKIVDCLSARAVSSYFHAITHVVLEHYKPLFKIKPEVSFVIYRGRKPNDHLENRAYLREKLGFMESFVFLAVGRQEFQKGHLVILQALKEITSHHPYIKNIKVVFLGREGEMTKDLNTFVETNRLEPFVEFLGFRNDVEEILAASDVFLFPSYFEGMGGALVEALAAGCPVICSDIPVLKEVIGREDGAVFVKPGDHRGIAEGMLQLYYDDPFRAELSQRSLDKFAHSYQIEEIYGQMLDMYYRIAKLQWK